MLDVLERRPELGQGHFEQVAGAQLAAGDTAGAAKTMESAGPEGHARWLAGIAREQAKDGNRDTAQAALRRALDEAERLLDTHAPPPTPIEEEQRRLFPANYPADRDLAHKDQIRGEIAEIHARAGPSRRGDHISPQDHARGRAGPFLCPIHRQGPRRGR